MKFKKSLFHKSIMLVITLCMLFPKHDIMAAEQSEPSINKKTMELLINESEQLKIRNTTEAVLWKSSDTKIAMVNENGFVTAKTPGSAIITGTIKQGRLKKIYTCALQIAPFPVKPVKFGTLTAQIPKNYTIQKATIFLESENSPKAEKIQTTQFQVSKKAKKNEANPMLVLLPIWTNTPSVEYKELKKYAKVWSSQTGENLNKTFGSDGKITTMKYSNIETPLGNALKLHFQYQYTENNGKSSSFSTTIYLLSIRNYMIQLTYIDNGVKLNPSLDEVAQHLLRSIREKSE